MKSLEMLLNKQHFPFLLSFLLIIVFKVFRGQKLRFLLKGSQNRIVALSQLVSESLTEYLREEGTPSFLLLLCVTRFLFMLKLRLQQVWSNFCCFSRFKQRLETLLEISVLITALFYQKKPQ